MVWNNSLAWAWACLYIFLSVHFWFSWVLLLKSVLRMRQPCTEWSNSKSATEIPYKNYTCTTSFSSNFCVYRVEGILNIFRLLTKWFLLVLSLSRLHGCFFYNLNVFCWKIKIDKNAKVWNISQDERVKDSWPGSDFWSCLPVPH